MSERTEQIKIFMAAFAKVDRNKFVEDLLASDFTFSAPPDPLLDRDGFFEKCWPYGKNLKENRYVRLVEVDDEVILTHEFVAPDGSKARNTDIFTFRGKQITRFEVYFGWAVSSSKEQQV